MHQYTVAEDGPTAMDIFQVPATREEISANSEREALVSKFAASLGVNAEQSDQTGSNIFLEALSDTVAAHEVIFTVPSLDIHSGDTSKDSRSSPLPFVGTSHNGTTKVPKMVASVLAPPATNGKLESQDSDVDKAAAEHLSSTTSWTKFSLEYAPGAIAKNIAASFSSLVVSRVRSWTLLLLRHSLSAGNNASRKQLLGMLSTEVQLTNSTTSFTTLPLPESARGLQQEYDVILPLLFRATLRATTKGSDDNVVLRAPGTISAHFAEDTCGKIGLQRIDIRLDTVPLLESLMEQARLVVFKAVASATKASEKDKENNAAPKAPLSRDAPPAFTPQEKPGGGIALMGFKSAQDLSNTPTTDDEPIELRKTRSSALRLNMILTGNSSSKTESKKVTTMMETETESASDKPTMNEPLDKTRKHRSVRWNHPMEAPVKEASKLPVAKRQRVAASSVRLRSVKSFGKAYAVGSRVGNATFAEFGRVSSSNDPMWGRDGKLRFHPTPEGPSLEDQPDLSPSAPSNANASFKAQRPQLTSLHGLTRSKSSLLNNTTSDGEI